MKIKTNEHAREAIAKAGITTDNVTDDQLLSLWHRLGEGLKSSGNYNGTYRINELKDIKFMTCRTEQWNKREAISFNRDGFIGFAGWADSSNVRPILEAVEIWLNDLGK